ncbi:unnamed protein product [Cyclocybe aegerita]|uniref:Uncharacterized protein n=1 Tax=Cyclocybe aegerita TaxID=1973307 RepID=A0A8S0W5A1_CYCAE|nr:unnamed protein product [Cyclocybe aegerita]
MKTSTDISSANAPYSFRVQVTKGNVHDGSESQFRGLEYSWTAKELDSAPSLYQILEVLYGKYIPLQPRFRARKRRGKHGTFNATQPMSILPADRIISPLRR